MKVFKRLTIIALVVACTLTLAGCAGNYSYTSGFGTAAKIKQYDQAGNLWTALSDDFNLPDETDSNPAVAWQIKWFMQNPGYLKHMADSAAPFLYYIFQQVKKRHLPAELALLPMVESAYDPFATNYGSGAAGLWQMIPSTASGFGLRLDWWYDGRRDVIASTNAALNYFVFLGKYFNNNWLLAIAAYDSGEGTVENAIHRNAKIGRSTSFWALKLPYETETYVPKLLALATIIKHPDEYHVKLPVIKNSPYLARINIGSQIDLAHAAKMAGISLGQLAMLNPGFNRWATDPNGPHTLVLPISHAARFKRALKVLPISKRVSWHRIIVEPGYALNKIAKTYNTSTSLIRQINHLQNNTLHVGQVLLIPSSNDTLTHIVQEKEHHFIQYNKHVRLLKITRHTVLKGETLWTIAEQYHVSPREIRFWNSLRSNDVQPGTSLIIWPPRTKANPTYWQPTYRQYIVKPGNSLWQIANKFHMPIKTITRINGIKHNDIRPGQILKIPLSHEYVAPPKSLRHSNRKQHKKITHTKHKKKLSRKKHSIDHAKKETKKHHTTIKKLDTHKKAQHKKAAKRHKITTYHVKKGDNTYKVAAKFHMQHQELLKLNHLNRKSSLRIEQVVHVAS